MNVAATKASPAVQRSRAASPRTRAVSFRPYPLPTIARCACGGNCPRCKAQTFSQPKLKINAPNDTYEQEADQIAGEVMRMPGDVRDSGTEVLAPSNHSLQRKCSCGGTPGPTGECEKCRKKRLSLQRRAAKKQEPARVPPIVHEVLRSPGQPLDASTRAFMESRFGHDFSRLALHAAPRAQAELVVGQAGDQFEQEADSMADTVMQMPEPRTLNKSTQRAVADFSHVRLHADARAAESARAVNAKAYTVGHDIVFGEGRYRPETRDGRKLLAHELAHTIQQSSTGSIATAQLQRTIGDGHDLTAPRFAGDAILEAVFDNERLLKVGDKGPAVSKVQQALADAGFPLPKFGVDGDFGSETKGAVENFQRASGLTGRDVDGIVGPITMGLLNTRFTNAPTMPSGLPGALTNLLTSRKTVTFNVSQLAGTGGVVGDMARAGAVFAQANVGVNAGTVETLSAADSAVILGGDNTLDEFTGPALTGEESVLVTRNRTAGRITVYHVPSLSNGSRGEAMIPSFHGVVDPSVVVSSTAKAVDTLAHELGHAIMDDASHSVDASNLMAGGGIRNFADQLDFAQIVRIRASRFAT
jgi:peptidoglycan hydrolase-like protein with peptidoglycan-binding domain